MKCQQCGQEMFLPFQCPYCGGQFCTLHRLPENHACPKIDAARASRQEEVVVLQSPKSYEYSVTLGHPQVARGRVYFSPKELKHLAVAGLLVMSIGLSSAIYYNSALEALAILAVVLTGSFFAHEIAHKVVAQRRSFWAEFRLTMWGAILTLISIISPVFKVIAPGAVMISGSARREEMGKISLAGPATNIVFASIFLGLSFFPTSFSWIFLFSSLLNGFMAVFNLIPIGILDGFKIYNWDKKIWGVAFAAGLSLTIVAYVLFEV